MVHAKKIEMAARLSGGREVFGKWRLADTPCPPPHSYIHVRQPLANGLWLSPSAGQIGQKNFRRTQGGRWDTVGRPPTVWRVERAKGHEM